MEEDIDGSRRVRNKDKGNNENKNMRVTLIMARLILFSCTLCTNRSISFIC